jgi:molybdopterin-guanine dinucleotide biosynthesis protein A
VLLGGRSSRMGRAKALLELEGEPLVERVARRVQPLVDELLLVASPAEDLGDVARAMLATLVTRLTARAGAARKHLRPAPPLPEPPVRLVHDRQAFRGPVAGLATGLGAARAELAVTVACDAPFLEPVLLEHLLGLAVSAGLDVVVPRHAGRLEPLCAVYRVATMAATFAAQLEEDDLKPTARFGEVRTRIVEEGEWRPFDPEGSSFVNLNHPADYRAALARLGADG